jgi:catechol 2,3-dioxygenase-like lactoylglutathione lyase family enzyme
MLRNLILTLWLAAAAAASPLVEAVDSIGITVSDLDRAVEFYTRVLDFQVVKEYEAAGEEFEHWKGVFGLRVRAARLRLGGEEIELTEYLAPKGAAMPADSRANDRWFQHIAIIVTDMKAAYARLRSHKVRHASSGPQRLPDWNPTAGGIEAFYFQDPDGHVLEVLAFPKGKGEKWHKIAATAAAGAVFLGIDHTAIVISDTDASLRFYRDVLGLQVAGESENYGPEQERLNNVFGARLRITALRAGAGPGIEFLEYLAPRDGRPYPPGARANDLAHWHTRFLAASAEQSAQAFRNSRSPFISPGAVSLSPGDVGFRKSVMVRDPDGHALEVVQK